MNYAEFSLTVERWLSFRVDTGAIHTVIRERLGIEKPMEAQYSEGQLVRVTEAITEKGHTAGKKEVRLIPSLAQQGTWFRASSYELKDGWIEGSGKVERYSLPEVLEDLFGALVDLGKNVCIRRVKKGVLELAPKEHERYLEFCSRFGLLGLRFRRVQSLYYYPHPEKPMLKVQAGGETRQDAGAYFGECLRAPVHDFKSLCTNYREPAFNLAMGAVSFSLTARHIAKKIWVPGEFKDIEEAFTNSTPRISMEGGGLSVMWEPNSLIDAACLHLFKVTVEGKYRFCADPECGKRFPKDGKRVYCSDRCRWRHNKAKKRGEGEDVLHS